MKVPQYENQVSPGQITAARPQASGPVSGAFGEKLAAAGENLARSVGQAAGQMDAAAARLEARNRNLRLTAAQLNWQKENDEILNGKLGADGKRMEGGLLTKEYNDAESITQDYLGKKQELMDKHLSSAADQEEYDLLQMYFEKDFQNNFDRVAQYQLKQQRATGDLLTDAYIKTQAGQAGAIRTPEQMRNNLDATYKVFNDNADANSLPADIKTLKRYGLANDNVTNAVQGAIYEGNLAAARRVLDGAKEDLLPDDYNKLNAFLNKAQKTADAAGKDSSASFLYARALKMAQNNPEELQGEIVALLRNPAAALDEYSKKFGDIEAKKLLEYAKWTQTNLLDSTDTRSGQIKQEKWLQYENGFSAFNWKKRKDGSFEIKNKDMNNPQTVLAAISALEGHIKAHDFDKENTKKAEKDLTQLRQALGSMKIKQNDTALGEIAKQADLLSGARTKVVATGYYTPKGGWDGISRPGEIKEPYQVGGILTPEEKGIIVQRAANFLQAANINLLAEDNQARQAAVAATQTIARDYVKSKFAVVRDDVTDVQVGNETFKSYGIKPNPNLGESVRTNLDGYRYEEHNGVAYLIKRDKNNNELHRQLL